LAKRVDYLENGMGLRLARTENKKIKAGFGDSGHFLRSTKGVSNTYTLFIFIQFRKILPDILNLLTRITVGISDGNPFIFIQ